VGGRSVHVINAVLPICEQKFDESSASSRLFEAGRRAAGSGAQGGGTLDHPKIMRDRLYCF
jgi:hypothetical protein